MAASMIAVLTFALAAVAIAPFVRIPHGLVRVCGFPRVQMAVLAAALIPLTLWAVEESALRLTMLAVQALVVGLHLALIAKFTPVWPRQTADFSGSEKEANAVSILSCNVKQSNRDFDRILDFVRSRGPDIMIFMETDDQWANALKPLADKWEHAVTHPRDNSYGMVVYSRFKLTSPKVEFQVMEGVPSIVTTVALPDGAKFRLYAIHPEPPVPYASSLGRDAELIVTAERVSKERLPCIVTGDLNDVAWSHTTRQFQRLSGLLDPRVGRGLYNTFDARFVLMRWPLDHLFHDRRFKLIDMEVCPDVGSDHFPIYFKLALTPEADAENRQVESANGSDRREAEQTKRETRKLKRGPIGENWEK